MGNYAKSPNCVKKVLPYLDEMLEHTDLDEFRFRTDEPVKFAAQMREAFRFLRECDHAHYLNRYVKYHDLAKTFQFMSKAGFVKVMRRVPKAKVEVDVYAKSLPKSSLDIENHTVKSITDVFSIVGFISKHREIGTIFFPNAILTGPDEIRLTKWCFANSYLWSHTPSGGIEVSKPESKMKEILDNPDDGQVVGSTMMKD